MRLRMSVACVFIDGHGTENICITHTPLALCAHMERIYESDCNQAAGPLLWIIFNVLLGFAIGIYIWMAHILLNGGCHQKRQSIEYHHRTHVD